MHRKQSIYISVDVVIFSIVHGKLSTVLIRRRYDPFKGEWALPGGFVGGKESLEQAIRREIKEETGISDLFLLELKTFSEVSRDPRDRVVSVLFMGVVTPNVSMKAGSDVESVMFCPIDKLPFLAFDHREMVLFARKYLAINLWASSLAHHFLPQYFTLTELQNLYELIALREREVRNFRKKIISRGVIKPTKKSEHSVGHRPARLYKFSLKRNYLLP